MQSHGGGGNFEVSKLSTSKFLGGGGGGGGGGAIIQSS